MKVEELLGRNVFEYDKDLFISTVNEAYSNWKKNDNYNKRIQMQESPEEISKISDIYQVPLIDMVEFKELSDLINRDHPLKLNNNISLKNSIYSSGTTKGNQSIVPHSEEGLSLQQKYFHKLAPEIVTNIDLMHVIAPSESDMEKLPENQKNKAVMKYAKWGFLEPFKSKAFVKIGKEGIIPQFSELEESLKKEPGNKAIFAPPLYVDMFISYLENKNSKIDLGDRGIITTAGGWKGMNGRSKEDFRSRMEEFLGINKKNHVDFYGFSESMIPAGNRAGDSNPDMKRIPSQGFVFVADQEVFLNNGEIKKVNEGKEGLAVFIDPLNPDYPGAILTDDIVRKVGGDYGKDVRIEYLRRATE